mmetsp:Transcript_12286/g.44801  ORF Transcript_12286/g.44801 Transcript_12286/m.44801 type:complete len:402 (-) Transcript_12286:48-1253(-)
MNDSLPTLRTSGLSADELEQIQSALAVSETGDVQAPVQSSTPAELLRTNTTPRAPAGGESNVAAESPAEEPAFSRETCQRRIRIATRCTALIDAMVKETQTFSGQDAPLLDALFDKCIRLLSELEGHINHCVTSGDDSFLPELMSAHDSVQHAINLIRSSSVGVIRPPQAQLHGEVNDEDSSAAEDEAVRLAMEESFKEERRRITGKGTLSEAQAVEEEMIERTINAQLQDEINRDKLETSTDTIDLVDISEETRLPVQASHGAVAEDDPTMFVNPSFAAGGQKQPVPAPPRSIGGHASGSIVQVLEPPNLVDVDGQGQAKRSQPVATMQNALPLTEESRGGVREAQRTPGVSGAPLLDDLDAVVMSSPSSLDGQSLGKRATVEGNASPKEPASPVNLMDI